MQIVAGFCQSVRSLLPIVFQASLGISDAQKFRISFCSVKKYI